MGVPVVEPGGTVPCHQVPRKRGHGRVGGGGGEDRVVVKGNPLHFVFGRDGAPLPYIRIVQVEIEPHFVS